MTLSLISKGLDVEGIRIAFESYVVDLSAVIEAARAERFCLFGMAGAVIPARSMKYDFQLEDEIDGKEEAYGGRDRREASAG